MSDNETFVLKPEDTSAIIRLDEPAIWEQIAETPADTLLEVANGYFASGKGFLGMLGCRMVNAARKGELLQQIQTEFNDLRKKGKFPTDVRKNKFGYASWTELVSIIDNDPPDEELLEVLKAMFYSVNQLHIDDQKRAFHYELFRLAKEMNSSELLLFKQIQANPTFGNMAEGWSVQMSRLMGHNVPTLASRDLQRLVDHRLVTANMIKDNNNQSQPTGSVQLSDLGNAFFGNLRSYEIAKKE